MSIIDFGVVVDPSCTQQFDSKRAQEQHSLNCHRCTAYNRKGSVHLIEGRWKFVPPAKRVANKRTGLEFDSRQSARN